MMPPHHPPINFSATLRQPRTTKLDIQGELNLLIIADPPKTIGSPDLQPQLYVIKKHPFWEFWRYPLKNTYN